MVEQVILVDENDNKIGSMEKIEAHKDGGKLHRAFSIFVFNSKGEMLLQKRASGKFDFAGLWTNACCSHPRPGEDIKTAAHRKLKQEFGFDINLKEVFSFIYNSTDEGSNLTEHEFDHVFIGKFDGEPNPNPEEIDDFKWVDIQELKKDISENPSKYTPWFKIILEKGLEKIAENY